MSFPSRLPINRLLLADAVSRSVPTPTDVQELIDAALVPYSTTAQTATYVATQLIPYATTAAVTSAISAALTTYSTTTQMNTAIASALVPYSTTVQMDAAISAAVSAVSATPPGVYIRTNGATLTSGYGRTGSTSYAVVNSGAPGAGEVGYQRGGVGIYNISFGSGVALPALNNLGYQVLVNGNNGAAYQACWLGSNAIAGTVYVQSPLGALTDPSGDTTWSLMSFGLPV